ncbi:MAG: class I SAM-dependent methyltransferase [Phycisphaeraceae bacterium]|nr:class I SAM-dependent methyltransferase [Phycisphaeraceae bacterium]
MLDKFDLYEICVQSPDYDVRMLDAIHGASPRTLGEDFCGSAAISRAWVARGRGRRAVAVDSDRATLERAQSKDPGGGRITYVLADVLQARERCDIVTVQNFSICELRERPALVRYLSHARSRLARGGVFACDIYAGSDVFFTGRIRREIVGPGGEKITYTWEHRTTDPLRARVQNAMHFVVRPPAAPPPSRTGRSAGRAAKVTDFRSGVAPKARTQRFDDAFNYDWRLWSPPELADAMMEAGFSRVQFYPRFAEAIDDRERFHVLPIEDSNELSDSFSVYVVARK